MKRIAGIILALALFAPAVWAQEEHGEFGVFADYTRLHNLRNGNLWGVGGQLAFNLNRFVQLEGSMAYDFERNFTTINTNNGSGSASFSRSGLRLLNGLFGPKIQTGIGPVKAFVTVKGGFLNFNVSRKGPFSGFTGALSSVPSGDTNGVFYPGAGVEFFAHWFGVRAEVGDQIYFDNGANHNLKITFGPQFRF
ncbi:MAG TPA: hypothetical protein VFA76_14820 [Terriglobales bacterium]|nr:hypothetical protein [Terriglobales bacterium]